MSSSQRHSSCAERQGLLATHATDTTKPIPDPRKVTLVARKIRHLINQLIPVQIDEALVTTPRGHVITTKVLDLVQEAGGDLPGCVVYCCLYVCRYFRRLCLTNLPDADVNQIRALACEVIAKQLLERETDEGFLFGECLLRRYAILQRRSRSDPKSAVELAVDVHIPRVIASSPADEAIRKIWRGDVLVKYAEDDSLQFAEVSAASWLDKANVPRNQNALQIILSLVFLLLYTAVVNTANRGGAFDVFEVLMYLFVAGYLADEVSKVWKVGYEYVGFWNVLNLSTWSLIVASFVLRILALVRGSDADVVNSYRVLSTAAPLVWTRLLLYLDQFRFFGVLIIVTKVLLQESLIFIALTAIMIAGFVQAFLGFDASDGSLDRVDQILHSITQATLGSATFDQYEGWPLIIYYAFSAVMTVVLLNVLVALFNEAYSQIYGNAIDEWLALRAGKTLQFVRAPDENVYIAPLNLVELLIVPLELVLPKHQYHALNRVLLATLYLPYLAGIAAFEALPADLSRYILGNDKHKEAFDDDDLEDEAHGIEWINRVDEALPPLESEMDVLKALRKEIQELRERIDNQESSAGVPS
ncbi:Calcium channel yvc1 [Savitreella phatthalungensis]